MKYTAEIYLSPKLRKMHKIDVEVDKVVEETTYDEVIDAVYEAMDEKFPESDFPKADINRIWIHDEDTVYPVVDEDDKVSIKKLEKSKDYKKFLVLPWARYSITEECKLWMKLKEEGLVPANSEFDYVKYHAIIEEMQKER